MRLTVSVHPEPHEVRRETIDYAPQPYDALIFEDETSEVTIFLDDEVRDAIVRALVDVGPHFDPDEALEVDDDVYLAGGHQQQSGAVIEIIENGIARYEVVDFGTPDPKFHVGEL